MKNKIKDWFLISKKYFKKTNKKIVVFILFLMILSGVVRGYNFKEWLLVRADQVRDSSMAREFLENGAGSLRLLGPKITTVKLDTDIGRGDTLHMGPYYYYVQAFSMKILGTPSFYAIALPDFILSILAIPLFYLILAGFFTKKTSLVTTILFSFSFLIIQYSRFSWNPNQLIFWQLVLIYSLIRFSELKRKNGWWLVAGFLALLIISQLHFLATAGTTMIFVVFFFYQKGWRKLKLKHYLIAILLFTIFHIPMVVSDLKNDGDNYKRFLTGISQQSSEKSFKKNVIETANKSARFYFYFPLPISEEEFSSIQPIRLSYLAFSLILIVFVFWDKFKFLKVIKPKEKKRLALLILLYFGFFFIMNISMADRLEKPRYWLSIAPIAFFIVAFWLELIGTINRKYWSGILLIGIVSFLIFENGYSVYYWYSSLKEGAKRELPFKDPILRPHRELITLGQIERASDFMVKEATKENKAICYFSLDYQTKNAFKYVIGYKTPKTLAKRLDSSNESSKDCMMFVISKSDKKIEGIKEDLADRFNYKKIYRDGAIILWQLEVRAGQEKPKRGTKIFDNNNSDTKIRSWQDVFNK